VPVESHSGAREHIPAGPLSVENFRIFLNGAFWCTLMLLSDDEVPQTSRGPLDGPDHVTRSICPSVRLSICRLHGHLKKVANFDEIL